MGAGDCPRPPTSLSQSGSLVPSSGPVYQAPESQQIVTWKETEYFCSPKHKQRNKKLKLLSHCVHIQAVVGVRGQKPTCVGPGSSCFCNVCDRDSSHLIAELLYSSLRLGIPFHRSHQLCFFHFGSPGASAKPRMWKMLNSC